MILDGRGSGRQRESASGYAILPFSPLRLFFPVSIRLTETRVSVAKRVDLRRWALVGAEQRLVQIADETAAIHRAFPELRGRAKRSSSTDSSDSPPRKHRRRRKMSAEARKRISDAQKARWAKQRASGGTKKR